MSEANPFKTVVKAVDLDYIEGLVELIEASSDTEVKRTLKDFLHALLNQGVMFIDSKNMPGSIKECK